MSAVELSDRDLDLIWQALHTDQEADDDELAEGDPDVVADHKDRADLIERLRYTKEASTTLPAGCPRCGSLDTEEDWSCSSCGVDRSDLR